MWRYAWLKVERSTGVGILTVFVGCAREPGPQGPIHAATPMVTSVAGEAFAVTMPTAVTLREREPYAFDDGDDDPPDPKDALSDPLPKRVRFSLVGQAPSSLTRICDLTSFRGSLYAAHANQTLDSDGATITSYRRDNAEPDGDTIRGAFSVAFDWNRIGEPRWGGGGGQGFLRVHRFHGRLFVADADPPYGGFGLVDHGTEGYVFVSDAEGRFARPRSPHARPPGPPDAINRAGAGVVPRAYHVLDVARYENTFVASTGSAPPGMGSWRGPYPGALHLANADLSRWTYEVDYPYPYENNVWRLTYLVRFRGKLYAGIQDYYGIDSNDYVLWDAPDHLSGSSTRLEDELAESRKHMRAVRVTASGAAATLRWYVDPERHRLYWIASAEDGVRLRVTDDGETWRMIALPDDAGGPTDVVRAGDALVVLTERALFRLDATEKVTELGHVDDVPSPFALTDFMCATPLEVYRGALYVGDQLHGRLYRVDPNSP